MCFSKHSRCLHHFSSSETCHLSTSDIPLFHLFAHYHTQLTQPSYASSSIIMLSIISLFSRSSFHNLNSVPWLLYFCLPIISLVTIMHFICYHLGFFFKSLFQAFCLWSQSCLCIYSSTTKIAYFFSRSSVTLTQFTRTFSITLLSFLSFIFIQFRSYRFI